MADQNKPKDTIEVPIILLKKMAKYDRTARKILREHFHVVPAKQSVKVNPDDQENLFEIKGEKVNEEKLRAMAKEAGIKNWHNKKPENLVEELTGEEFD